MTRGRARTLPAAQGSGQARTMLAGSKVSRKAKGIRTKKNKVRNAKN